MIWLRSTIFNLCFYSWTLLVCTLCSPLLLFQPKIVVIAGRIWAWGMALLLHGICGVRWQLEGQEHLPPQGGYIVACQHQSAWETFIFYTVLRYPAYILKKSLIYIPLFGWYTARIKTIAVNRSGGVASLKDMVRQATDRLQNGRQVIIFPHGTRLPYGVQQPLQPGIAAIYNAAKEFPVVPMTLDSGRCWPKNSWKKYPGVVTLRIHPTIPAGLSRQELMNRLDVILGTVS